MPLMTLFRRLTDISPEFLLQQQIRLLLMDVDNTLSPYRINTPTKAVTDWAAAAKDAGIALYIVSNSRTERPRIFAEALGIEFVGTAHKPSPKALRFVMNSLQVSPENTAIIGDQFYTDALAGALAGCRALIVHPIQFTNPLLALRYGAEMPFRILLGRKHESYVSSRKNSRRAR